MARDKARTDANRRWNRIQRDKKQATQVSLLQWMAGDNKPDALGFVRFDPVRLRAVMSAMRKNSRR